MGLKSSIFLSFIFTPSPVVFYPLTNTFLLTNCPIFHVPQSNTQPPVLILVNMDLFKNWLFLSQPGPILTDTLFHFQNLFVSFFLCIHVKCYSPLICTNILHPILLPCFIFKVIQDVFLIFSFKKLIL